MKMNSDADKMPHKMRSYIDTIDTLGWNEKDIKGLKGGGIVKIEAFEDETKWHHKINNCLSVPMVNSKANS